MKIQDILFILFFISLIVKGNKTTTLLIGLGCLILAMPLFYFQVFFTAERLTWYATGFILLSILKQIHNT